MVNNITSARLPRPLGPLVVGYAAVCVATLAAARRPREDGARPGDPRGLGPRRRRRRLRGGALPAAAVGSARQRRRPTGGRVIGAVLVVVNLVEALLPGTFPTWMRVEMVLLAVVMAVVAGLALRPAPR